MVGRDRWTDAMDARDPGDEPGDEPGGSDAGPPVLGVALLLLLALCVGFVCGASVAWITLAGRGAVS